MTETTTGPHAGIETLHACPDGGHMRIPLRRRPGPGIYVGHPITGIGVGRILAMQDAVAAGFSALGLAPALYFPMRSTHLAAHETGANEYDPGAGLFAGTRHFTGQNRIDAVHHADGVLLNYGIRDDAGDYRVSRGIPFDLGWARALGKPVVAVISRDNPNLWPGLERAAEVHGCLDAGIGALARAVGRGQGAKPPCWIEAVVFPGDRVDLGLIARLAEADARKGLGSCAAVIAVMPGGRANPNWHGQVGEVADWVLPDLASAIRVADVLGGAPLGSAQGT